MKIELTIHTKADIPVVESYRDKYMNPKTTNFLVWDEDGINRFAVYNDGKFRYLQNKKEIKNVMYWAEVPRQIEGGI